MQERLHGSGISSVLLWWGNVTWLHYPSVFFGECLTPGAVAIWIGESIGATRADAAIQGVWKTHGEGGNQTPDGNWSYSHGVCIRELESDACRLASTFPRYSAVCIWRGRRNLCMANLSAIMGVVGKESQGTIGAVQRMIQNLGIAVDTAVAAAFIWIYAGSGTAGLMVGFREAWGYATFTLFISLLLILFIFVRKHGSPLSIDTGDDD